MLSVARCTACTVATFALIIALVGCNAPPLIDPAYREIPEHQADAGYASAAVVSVLPMSEASSVLGGTTTMTFPVALSLVQAYSRYQHQQVLNALDLGLNVGLSGRTRTGTQSDLSTTSGATTDSGSSTSQVTPASSVPGTSSSTTTTTTFTNSTGTSQTVTSTQTIVQGTASTPTFATTPVWPSASASFGTPTVTINPAVAIQAADQLVKIYNSVAKQFANFPYSKATQDAYVVQLKTTLQPHKPALPLDAYVSVTAAPIMQDGGYQSVSLSPLAFGTEEYEFSQEQTADTFLRGLSLGLTAVGPGGSAGAAARSMVGRVLEASVANVNGLISATPLSPSTVQIRLGAMWQGATDRAMIPRSFHGFFVLLVPKDYSGSVELVTKPLFRDPKTGSYIAATPPPKVVNDVKTEFCTFGVVLEQGCATRDGAAATAAEVQPSDEWYNFMRRLRRNDTQVLACVRMRPKAAAPVDVEKRCRSYRDGPELTAMVSPGEATAPLPSYLLGPFLSEINRVGLQVRTSSTFVHVGE